LKKCVSHLGKGVVRSIRISGACREFMSRPPRHERIKNGLEIKKYMYILKKPFASHSLRGGLQMVFSALYNERKEHRP